MKVEGSSGVPQTPSTHVIGVAVELPKHSDLSDVLDYLSASSLPLGSFVDVPLGKRLVRGVVWERVSGSSPSPDVTLRPIGHAFDGLPPLDDRVRALITFAASYYQRGVGELAMACLPPLLRSLDAAQLARALKKAKRAVADDAVPSSPHPRPEPTTEQHAALQALADSPAHTTLLFGATGSGKTEVYLRAAEQALDAGRQVLVLVPEINLTPQLEARFAERFGAQRMVSLHSALTPAQRLQHWLAAHLGQARLVLGTRLAVFASLPQLGLIVVDEEHDPSFKQQEGARYSARDLAVWRGRHERVPVLLGSATPSLESWRRAQQGHYRRIVMRERVARAAMPTVRLLDMRALPRETLRQTPLAPPVMEAIAQRTARGEQSLVLLNRRGYAPVLHCTSCGWKSACVHCSAWRVFHKVDRSLRCHHCGWTTRVPRACPECGDLDIGSIGRGTQKLEEQLALALPGTRVARLDADTARRPGALQSQLAAVHDGEVDVLVGTQMMAKGHDFRRVTLVAAVEPDGALFTSDFRAPERLFALLMQAAGRAGRDAAHMHLSEMWVQTWHPQHTLYQALQRHDFEAFASEQLEQRQAASLPPYSSLALLRADAKTVEVARAFLQAAADAAQGLEAVRANEGLRIYPPVPLPVARVADVERLQMLVESRSREALQRMLWQWHAPLHALRAQHKGVVRYALDVDPLAI